MIFLKLHLEETFIYSREVYDQEQVIMAEVYYINLEANTLSKDKYITNILLTLSNLLQLNLYDEPSCPLRQWNAGNVHLLVLSS